MITQKDMQVLTFRLGTMHYCVPVEQVETIVETPRLTRLPMLPPFALGVFQHQGEAAAVVDLAILMGIEKQSDDKLRSCLLVTHIHGQAISFLVDAVNDLIDTAEYTWTEVPPIHHDQQIEHALLRDEEIILLLNLHNLRGLHKVLQQVSPASLQTPVVDQVEEAESTDSIEADLIPQPEEPKANASTVDVVAPDLPADVELVSENQPSIEAVDNKGDLFTDLAGLVDNLVQTARDTTAEETTLDHSEPPPAEILQSADHQDETVTEEIEAPDRSTETHEHAERINADIEDIAPVDEPEPPVASDTSADSKAEIPTDTSIAARTMHTHDRVYDEQPAISETDFIDDLEVVYVDDNQPLIVSNSVNALNRKRRRLFYISVSMLVLGMVLILLAWFVFTPDKPSDMQVRDKTAQTASVNSTPAKPVTPAAESEVQIIHKQQGPERLVVELPEHRMQVYKSEEVKRDASLARPVANVIKHVVIKGDTLWDIAKKYLANPFRYPELAAKSGIRNPHLIYPGDVVVISRKKP